MFDFKKKWKEDEYFRKVIKLFVILKVIILVVGLAGQFIPEEITHRQTRSDNIFLNPWTQYDAGAYLDIAENGYNQDFVDGRGNYAWYPFYPLLITIFSPIGIDLSAFLVANVASFLSVIILYSLVKEKLDSKKAYRTIFLMMLFPTAFFFTAMYTESIFLLLTVSMFYLADKGRFLEAGILGFFVGMTRTQGIIMFLPLLYMYARSIDFNYRKINIGILGPFLVPLGMVAFLVYHGLVFGDYFILFNTHEGFNRAITFPWVSIVNEVSGMFSAPQIQYAFYHFLNLSIFISALGIFLFTYKKMPPEYSIYIFLSFLIPSISASLEAMMRFILVLFPIFMYLAVIEEKSPKIKKTLTLIYPIFFVLLILFTLRHVNEDILLTPMQVLNMVGLA